MGAARAAIAQRSHIEPAMMWRMSSTRLLACAGIILAVAGSDIPGAYAQSFTGRGPAEPFAVPKAGGSERPAASPRTTAAATGNAPGPAQPTAAALGTVRRLPSSTRGYRLSGEEDNLRFPVYLTEGQARSPARLRISYLSAVSVAPESSELAAYINGVKIGWTQIQAPGGLKVVELPVPANALRAGYNDVLFAASQRHRVDCSVDATYELWTQIDVSHSGLDIAPPSDLDVRTLAALEPDGSGALPVRIVTATRPNTQALEQAFGAVQALALVDRLVRPSVTFGPPLAGRSGVNLVVGSVAELRDMEIAQGIGSVTGPTLTVPPPRPNQAPTLIVSGRNREEVAEAIRNLAAVGESSGTRASETTVNLTRGYRVFGGERVTLDDLAVTTREFNGRLFRTVLELRLPADFIPADYGKVTLHLAGGYAAGLEKSAKVLVDVNGRNAASVPLVAERGELFSDNVIPLPLSLWRPGLNRIEITAHVPSPADDSCVTANAAPAGRFLLLDRTRLEIPELARAIRLPDLAAFEAGALPLTLAGARPRLILPTPDRETAEAAAMIVARLAVAARRLIDFEVSTEEPAPGRAGARLVIAPVRALTPNLLEAVGFDPAQVREAWGARSEVISTPAPGLGNALTLDRLRRGTPMRCVLPSVTMPVRPSGEGAAEAPRPQPLPDRPTAGLATQWDEAMRGSQYLPRVFKDAWDGISRTARRLSEFVTSWFRKAPVVAVNIDPRASLVVAEGRGGPQPTDSITLITSPNPALLKASVGCLMEPVVWNRLGGRATLLDGSDGSVSLVQPTSIDLAPSGTSSLNNERLIGAAWLSLNPLYYAGVTLALAIMLGLATANLFRNVGRRNS